MKPTTRAAARLSALVVFRTTECAGRAQVVAAGAMFVTAGDVILYCDPYSL